MQDSFISLNYSRDVITQCERPCSLGGLGIINSIPVTTRHTLLNSHWKRKQCCWLVLRFLLLDKSVQILMCLNTPLQLTNKIIRTFIALIRLKLLQITSPGFTRFSILGAQAGGGPNFRWCKNLIMFTWTTWWKVRCRNKQ